MSDVKTCATCANEKNVSLFDRSRSGYRSVCKQCRSEAAKRRYAEDEQFREARKEESRRNHKPMGELPREVAEKRREYKRERNRLGRICGRTGYKPAKHDAHVKEFVSKVRRDGKPHSAHVIAWYEWRRQQPWYQEWKLAKDRERARLEEAAKMAKDMGYRLNGRMRVAIRKALGGKKAGRRWEAILGYTMDQLRDHFAKQLPKKMTVEDALRAGWHIDHIVPKSLYDLSNEAELRAAWCMSNLRLIPAHENHSKHARRLFLL